MPDTSGLVAISVFNTKIGVVEDKILDVICLVTTAVLNAKTGKVENKIHDVSDIEEKYFTTSDYNKFTNDIVNAKIKEKDLVNESNISNLVKNSYLNAKLKTLETKAELKADQDKIVTGNP